MPGDKKQITRNRVSYSCQKCRQRKVKCDKVHPICGSCQKTGEECIYASSDPENPVDTVPQSTDVGTGKKRKSGLADLDYEDDDQNDTSRISTDLEAQLLQLSELLNQLSNIAGVKSCQHARNQNSERSMTNQDRCLTPELRAACDDGSNMSQLGTHNGQHALSASAERQILEPSQPPNLDTISAQLDQLTHLLRRRKADTTSDKDGAPTTIKPNPQFDMDEVLYVPNEHQRNALFRCWLSSVFPVVPVADPTLCLMHYRTFHFWYTHGLEKGIPNPVEDFVPLIYSIYLAGAASMSSRGIQKWFPGLSRQRMMESFRKQLMLALKGPTQLLTNPVALAARIMLYYLTSDDAEDTGLAKTSAPLVRLAYSCNLHRERANETVSTSLVEIRRRLWWETCNLDVLEACASKMPPSINHHYSDTYMLSEIKDAKIRYSEGVNNETALPEGHHPEFVDDPSTNIRDSPVSVIYLWMKARTILASVAMRILNVNLTAKPRTKEDMMGLVKSLHDVEREIKSIIDRIPTKGIPEQDFTPDVSKPGQSISHDHGSLYGEDLLSIEVEAISGNVSDCEKWEWPYVQQYRNSMIAFHKWARIALSMLIDTCYCLSYAPFLSNSKRKLWKSARQCALRHAHSCLRKFNALAGDIELERFRWAWPSIFQPIHACIIILLDTHEQPKSVEAPRSRALFDQMMSLSLPDHGILGGSNGLITNGPLQGSGVEAFKMLMQLRAKGWHKAGLDPRCLWTEQDQIDVGVTTPPTEAEEIARSFREDRILNGAIGKQSNHASSAAVHALCEPRNHEVSHPAELGVPDHEGRIDSIVDDEPADEVPGQGENQRRYRYARRDQQRMPFHCNGGRGHGNHQLDRGHIYPLKRPSEIFDIDQLIQRIRTVQQSGQEGSQVQGSPALYEQIATANSDLTSFLARKHPDFDTLPDEHNAVHVPKLPGSTETGTGNGASYVNNIPSQQQHQQQHNAPNDPTPAALHHHHSSNTSTAQQPGTNPDTAPEDLNLDMNMNMTDMLNMDFDWTKWDELFGHILDDEIAASLPPEVWDRDRD